MKKFLAWMLAAVLVLSMCTTVLASETSGSGKIESTEEGSNTNSKNVTASYIPTVVGEAEITGVSISGVTKNEEGIYVVRDDDQLTIMIKGKICRMRQTTTLYWFLCAAACCLTTEIGVSARTALRR